MLEIADRDSRVDKGIVGHPRGLVDSTAAVEM
jgi:hypothetical protein